jgi:hypothetical protein
LFPDLAFGQLSLGVHRCDHHVAVARPLLRGRQCRRRIDGNQHAIADGAALVPAEIFHPNQQPRLDRNHPMNAGVARSGAFRDDPFGAERARMLEEIRAAADDVVEFYSVLEGGG